MNEWFFYNLLIWIFGISSVGIFILLFFVSAPYGKHHRENWGLEINNRLGWFIMEFPTIAIFLFFFIVGKNRYDLVPIFFLIIWMIHYVQRTFIFPFMIRGNNRMPIMIIMFGLIFNIFNSYLQSRWIYTYSDYYSIEWSLTPFFISGVIIFLIGFISNIHSDYIIRNLRDSEDDKYKIPRGGLFKWVSSPNYLGEIIEWSGWAIMTWSIPGLIFAGWTFANLAPRAYATHIWYQEVFSDYPDERRALIPYFF